MAEKSFEELKKEYDQAGPMPALGGKAADFVQDSRVSKIKAMKELIKLAEKNIENKARELFSNYNVEFNITSSDGSIRLNEPISATRKDDFGKNVVDINLNMNYLSRLPAEEAYSAIYSIMFASVLKNKSSFVKEDDYEFGKNIDEKPSMKVDEKFDREGNYIQSESPLKYIIKFIKKLLGFDEELSTNIAKNVLQDTNMFSNTKNLRDVDRIAELNNKASQMLSSGEMRKALNYSDQAAALVENISKDQFNLAVNNNPESVKSFCSNYVSTFLRSNGLDPNSISLTFKNEGDLGEYIDNVDSHSININLGKVKNTTDLVMTLSHELTHAVDSSFNKQAGVVKTDGFGLFNSLGSNIDSTSAENQQVYSFVVKLEELSYSVCPDERHARTAELSALKFMQQMVTDGKMKDEIQHTIDNFIKYKEKTIKNLKFLNEKGLNSLFEEYEGLRNQIQFNETIYLINERLDYFRELKNHGLLESQNDSLAIEEALKISNQVKGVRLNELQTQSLENQLE